MSRNKTPQVDVWDLDGNKHSMSPLNARDMINNKRWTGHDPAKTREETSADKWRVAERGVDRPEERTMQDVIDAAGGGDTPPASDAGDDTPPASEPTEPSDESGDAGDDAAVDVNSFESKEDLAAFAQEKFNTVLDQRKSLDNLKAEVQAMMG